MIVRPGRMMQHVERVNEKLFSLRETDYIKHLK